MKTYDYKDETKDVRGKVTSNIPFQLLITFDLDWETKRHKWATTNAGRLEECSYADHT